VRRELIMARDLVLGSRGKDVAQVQAALNLKLLEPPLLQMDGVFGPETRRRVLAFQRRNGLVPDGVVGPNTWAKLFSPGLVFPTHGDPPVFVKMSQPDLMRIHQMVELVLVSETVLGITLAPGIAGTSTQDALRAARAAGDAARAVEHARRIYNLLRTVADTKL
jgi:peptidoglycan hydrolase-like protein with peptidoglycan-binding domain